MSCERTGRNMENTGKQFTADLVHIRNHQQKTLRRCKRCCQCSGFQGSVNRTGGACFGLHFCDTHFLSEQVDSAVCSPFIGYFRHRRRRSDRVDCSNIGKRIRNVCSSGIAINRHGFCHYKILLYYFGAQAPYLPFVIISEIGLPCQLAPAVFFPVIRLSDTPFHHAGSSMVCIILPIEILVYNFVAFSSQQSCIIGTSKTSGREYCPWNIIILRSQSP